MTRLAASGNILESWRRVGDGVDSTHKTIGRVVRKRDRIHLGLVPCLLGQHDQQAHNGGLPLGTALELLVLVQYRRDVVVPIEGSHSAVSA